MKKLLMLMRAGRVPLLLVAALALGACGGGSSDTDETSQPEDVVGMDAAAEVGTPEEVAPEDVCEPDCEGKECGDDGCGGICGNCFTFEGAIDNTLCLDDGTCGEAEPLCSCVDRECGEDDCGNSCGVCGDGFLCNDLFVCEEEPFSCTYEEFDSSSPRVPTSTSIPRPATAIRLMPSCWR